MPQLTLTFTDENAIPAELKAFKTADNKVVVWAGDKVAEETNPGLAANRDTIKGEKDTLQTKYDNEKAQWSQTNDTLSKEVIQLREKVATSAGVTTEEVALLAAVKPFGTDPAQIKTQLENGTKAAAENASLKREILVKDVAGIMGWKPSVLLDLVNHPEKSKDLELVIEDVTGEDQKVTKQVFVNKKDANGAVAKQPIADFMKATPSWGDYLPVLATDNKQNPTWLQQPKPTDKPADDKDLLSQHIENRNKAASLAPNPLRPQQPAATPPAGT